MNDEIDAAAKRIKGSIKEAIGMLIGDSAIEAEGAAEKEAGCRNDANGSQGGGPTKS